MQKSFSGQIVLPAKSATAIPIVAPNDAQQMETRVVLKPPSKGNSKRLCRNVIIHGFCKYEGQGCEFNHEMNKPSPQTSPENTKLRAQSPTSVSADSINAPEFVPRSTIDSSLNSIKGVIGQRPTNISNNFAQMSLLSNESNGMPLSPSQMLASMESYYYMNQPIYPRQPLQHHLYTSTPTAKKNILPNQRSIQSFFISEDVRQQLTEQNEAQLMTVAAHDVGLPSEVHVYHSLYPLDTPMDKPSEKYGYPSWVYKAVSSVDNCTYALVRIEGFCLANELAMSAVECWRRICHCNVISIREAFTSHAFGDTSLIFVFDYHPCSSTLFSTYFTPHTMHSSAIPESTLWSYTIQIASAIKTIHASGIAARNIDPHTIILTGKNHRVRLNGAGILDVLQFDGVHHFARYQQQDLFDFGKLLISLACHSTTAYQTLPSSLEYIGRYYSPDFKNVVLYLLSKPAPTKTIDEVVKMIGPRILQEINQNHCYNDRLETELAKELENGRIIRLLSKMGFINERPEFDMDPSWSETGDRYLIKLFRDYVFHQVDESGKPVIDMVHVLTCLNKVTVRELMQEFSL
ncbi:hypothetical protein K501DRAFT_244202 [Backusella circina FSU 941]|nr:hypothetical protein K501DRAFT_244202 [Backusella circina FSU 941]